MTIFEYISELQKAAEMAQHMQDYDLAEALRKAAKEAEDSRYGRNQPHRIITAPPTN